MSRLFLSTIPPSWPPSRSTGGAQRSRHFHMVAQTGSYSVQGMDIVSPPSLPDPKDLLPTLETQTLIIPAPSIVIVSAWQSLVSRIAKGSRKLEELHWKEFEDLMAEILETAGWSITPMGYTKDGGADIIAARNVEPGVPIEMLVQCKRNSRSRRVGVEVVREVWSAKWEKGSHQAMIATTSRFTKGARTRARLWNMDLRSSFHEKLHNN